jgi:predicted small lipoprotein YifL
MTRARVVVLGLWLAAGVTAAGGCGQQGPLVLPGDARPVERIDPAASDPEQNDEERRDER